MTPALTARLSDISRSVVANQHARAHYSRKGQAHLARHCDQRIEAHKVELNALMAGMTAEQSMSDEYTAVLDVYSLTLA